MAVDQASAPPRAPTRWGLSVDEVAHYTRDGSLYRAHCPSVRCCENVEHGGGVVFVHCTADGTCEVVGSTLGDCLTVLCAGY